jgi:hypothetical protein
MKEYNTITIKECCGPVYTEQVGFTFEEACELLLGKQGKFGSPIHSVSMDDPVGIQGSKFDSKRTAIYTL